MTLYTLTSAYSPNCAFYISQGIVEENLFNNQQEFLKLGIILFICVTLMFHLGVTL